MNAPAQPSAERRPRAHPVAAAGLDRTLFADTELRSAVSLPAGPWRYAADPTTEILCVRYAIGAGEPAVWVHPEPIPEPFLEAAEDKRWRLVTHNDGFERAIARRVLQRRAPRLGRRFRSSGASAPCRWRSPSRCRDPWKAVRRRSVSSAGEDARASGR